jgi:type II secretory pathway predicted ATPase ExeA
MTQHLNEATSKLLSLSDIERQRKLKANKWIPYPQALEAMKQMTELLHHPTTHRMPNLLLVGDTGSGKTSILKQFLHQHKEYSRQGDGQLIRPVLFLQTPQEPDERIFYEKILSALGVPWAKKDRTSFKQQQVIHNIRNMEVKLFIIDELQHILAGNTSKQRLFLNVIKYLSNELQISFVGAGIRSALNAVQHDEQLENRFEPFILENWKKDMEFLRLLASFERVLPLKNPSKLTQDKITYKLLAMSHGYIGDISNILKKAAVVAIEENIERINLDILNRLNYVRKSRL